MASITVTVGWHIQSTRHFEIGFDTHFGSRLIDCLQTEFEISRQIREKFLFWHHRCQLESNNSVVKISKESTFTIHSRQEETKAIRLPCTCLFWPLQWVIGHMTTAVWDWWCLLFLKCFLRDVTIIFLNKWASYLQSPISQSVQDADGITSATLCITS